MLRVMERLNLTLDEGTSGALARHARREGKPRAALARELIREAIARREAVERQQRLARDYAAGRTDAREILKDLEVAQFELLDREDA
jgi:Ribbon-helix-helix protein, copG family